MENKLTCLFNDETHVDIDGCVIPNPDIMITYQSFMDMLPDAQIIREADKSFVRIRDKDGRDIYEFYNMVLGSTQILENGDGTITVHYYFRQFG